MFYGKTSGDGSGAGAGRGNRNERYDQMVRQQQLIEQKKKEIQSRLEAERQKKAIELAAKPKCGSGASSASSVVGGSPSVSSTSSSSQRSAEESVGDIEEKKPAVPNVFSNDGSFFEQFKKMQEEAMKKKKQEEEKADLKKIKEEPVEYDEYGTPMKSNNRPMIKIINPDSLGRSSSPYNRGNDSGAPSHQSFYNVPPPPPPPPGMPPQKQEMKYFGGNSGGFQNVPPPPPPPPPVLPGITQKQFGGFPSPAVRALASVIAEEGDHAEEKLKMKHQGDPLMWFLFKPDSAEYRTFRALVAEIQSDNRTHMYNQAPPPPPGVKVEQIKTEPKLCDYSDRFVSESAKSIKREASSSDDEETEKERRERKRRSRWGPQATDVDVPPIGVAVPFVAGPSVPGSIPEMQIAIPSPGHSAGMNMMSMPLMAVPSSGPVALSKVTRANPQLLAYAKQAYGRTDLDEEEWKQCEEAYKMNLVFQDIARKKAKDEELEREGRFKHEYDSDEETDGGTWEHKQRMKEMEKTRNWADELTQKAKGKHHIGDFLPPEELAKFMEKYKAVKEGKRLDESEYQEYKIQQDNIGFKMLQKMGWSSGEGLGAAGQGIVAPIEKGNVSGDKQGLGTEKPGELAEDDDEFTAYRKRMMLAYRFRPNPLNNPRRAYY